MSALALALAVTHFALAAAARPNVIWLQADSVDGRLLDPTSASFSHIRSSGLKDALLARGASFIRHYANSPQCVPSRTSMVTSRYVHETNTANNGEGLAASTKRGKFPTKKLDSTCVSVWNATSCRAFAARQNVSATLLDLVAGEGYDLQLFGRFDVGAGILDDYPRTDGDGFHGGPDISILARGAAIAGQSDVEPWSATTSVDRAPFAHDASKAFDAIDWLTSTPPPGPSDAPFFLWLGILDPHPPYDTNATWLSHLNESSIDVPPLPPWENMHPYDAAMSTLKACTLDYTEHQLKTMRAAYWGACAEAFHLFTLVIAAANRSGHLDNTIVILTSDHGEMSMEHRQDLKNSMREPSTRVPLIIAPFGRAASTFPHAAGLLVTNLTSHLDIVPTIAELIGAPASLPASRGHSLVPFLTPPHARTEVQLASLAARPDCIAAEYHSNLAPTGSFMLRQGRFKLITYGHTFPWSNASYFVDQLFDVESDPSEDINLASTHPAVVTSMLATLEAELGGGGYPGSPAAIDADQMARNRALFVDFFASRHTTEELVTLVMARFRGPTREDVTARLTAWLAYEIPA